MIFVNHIGLRRRVIWLAKLATGCVLVALCVSCASSAEQVAPTTERTVVADGDAETAAGDAETAAGDAETAAGDADTAAGDAEDAAGDADTAAEDAAGDAETAAGEADTAADDEDERAGSTVAVANPTYLGSYTLTDDSFGTQVTVVVDGDTRTIASNTLPNHDTGDFPNTGNPTAISEQDRTWALTTNPVVTGQATQVRETGVALNGVKFEPGTAETTECTSGQSYRIEGLQDMFDLGMDFNNAHVQPTGEYHYHGVSELLVTAFDSDEDLVLVGFAADGHLMYYSKSAAYTSSYALSTTVRSGTDCGYRGTDVDLDGTTPDGTYESDWVYTVGQGDLDDCNGTMVGDEYAYLITEEYPYIPRCLMGEVNEAGPGGGGQAGSAPGREGQAGAPDLTDAAAALGLSEAELQDLLGGPPPDVAGAAVALDMTEADLTGLLAEFGVAPPSA